MQGKPPGLVCQETQAKSDADKLQRLSGLKELCLLSLTFSDLQKSAPGPHDTSGMLVGALAGDDENIS